MKRALALASLLVLAGCASDGYYAGYTGYSTEPYATYGYPYGTSTYGYYDATPYRYDTYRPYAYDTYPYAWGAPYVGGSVYYHDRDRRDRSWRNRDRDDRREWRRDADPGVAPAPAERMDRNNTVRPRHYAPPTEYVQPNPSTGMTVEESIQAGGR